MYWVLAPKVSLSLEFEPKVALVQVLVRAMRELAERFVDSADKVRKSAETFLKSDGAEARTRT